MTLRLAIIVLLFGPGLSCSSMDETGMSPLVIDVVLPAQPSEALALAKVDLEEASRRISTAAASASATARIRIEIDADAIGIEPTGYSLASDGDGLRIRAQTQIGAAYGLYHVAADLGVRYYHPQETFWPENPQISLPRYAQEIRESPRFKWRGFHEHTQHPTVMSDYLLRPDSLVMRPCLDI